MKKGGDISLGEDSIYHLPFEKKMHLYYTCIACNRE